MEQQINIQKSNDQPIYLDGTVIINEFFDLLIRRMCFTMFKKFYAPEEREAILNELYNKQMEQFTVQMKQIQMHDLKGYIELKNIIEQSFNSLKKYLCTDQPQEQPTESQETN